MSMVLLFVQAHLHAQPPHPCRIALPHRTCLPLRCVKSVGKASLAVKVSVMGRGGTDELAAYALQHNPVLLEPGTKAKFAAAT